MPDPGGHGHGHGPTDPRDRLAEERVELLSIGMDIGSTTSHLAICRVVLEKRGQRYVQVETAVVEQSPVILTPYADADTIDADELRRMVARFHHDTGIAPERIDTGAVILTGLALARENSRLVAEVFGAQVGRFVGIAAGDDLESALAARGSGALDRSRRTGGRVLNVDVGGGTAKLALCVAGRVERTGALDVGARLLTWADGRVRDVDRGLGAWLRATGIPLGPGDPVDDAGLDAVAAALAERVFAAAGLPSGAAAPPHPLLRTAPMPDAAPDEVAFSGGVAEYVYGRSAPELGDLGPALARMLRVAVADLGMPVWEPPRGIRSTVVGAAHHTVQLSGSTVHAPADLLPLHNVRVVLPGPVPDDVVADRLASDIASALAGARAGAGARPVALVLDWHGTATPDRLDALAAGLAAGTGAADPVVVVCSDDVAGLVGRSVADRAPGRGFVVLDGVELGDLDHLDVGAPVPGTGAVTVVVKSLAFPTRDSRYTSAGLTAGPAVAVMGSELQV